jgi:hypothetical protein
MRFSSNEKVSFFSSIIVISVLTALGIGLFSVLLATCRQAKAMN